MTDEALISRRAILGSLAVLPLPSATKKAVAQPTGDIRLQELGREFDVAAAQIDHAIDYGSELLLEVLDRLSLVENEIVAAQAAGIMGLRVKARAACWARLGDLNPVEEPTTDKRMALSIVRDLIRMCDANLERPGALEQLVAKCT